MRVADLWPVRIVPTEDMASRDLDSLTESDWDEIVGLLSDKVANDYDALDRATDEWAQRFPRNWPFRNVRRACEMNKIITAVAFAVMLTACDGTEAPNPMPSHTVDPRWAGCELFMELQVFAQGMAASNLTDEKVIARLAAYRAELVAQALALHRANYATDGDALLAVSNVVGDLEDAVESFGVRSAQARSARHNLKVASEAVSCP